MTVIYHLIPPILSSLILISIGFAAKSFRLLKAGDAEVLNKLIVYLFLPALIFDAFRGAEIPVSFFMISAAALSIGVVSLGIAYAVGKIANIKNGILGGVLLVSSVGNTGYLGYPLTQAILGSENLIRAVFYDIFGTVVFIFTVGLYIAETYGSGEKINKFREIVTFPPLIALGIGYLARDLSLPGFITDLISLLAVATIPLIMISIGLSLTGERPGKFLKPILVVSFIKLFMAPVAAVVAGKMIGLDQTSFKVLVLEASMPIAMLTSIIALKFGLRADFVSTAILTTTVLSLITVPFWQFVAQMVTG